MSMQPPSGDDPRNEDPPPGGYFTPASYPTSGPPSGHPEQLWPPYPGTSEPSGRPAQDPLVPPDLSGWFQRIIGVFRRSFVPLLILQTGLAVVSAIFQVQFSGFAEQFETAAANNVDPGTLDLSGLTGLLLVGLPILIVVSVFTQAASVFIAIRDAAGQPSTLGIALSFAARRALPLTGWTIVMTIMLTIGFMMLIIPGIYLMIVFGASLVGVVVVERGGIGRSFALVNPRFAATAGRVALAALIAATYSVIVGLITGGSGPMSGFYTVISVVLTIPLSIAAIGFIVVTYAELRNHENPQIKTPQLAAELNR